MSRRTVATQTPACCSEHTHTPGCSWKVCVCSGAGAEKQCEHLGKRGMGLEQKVSQLTEEGEERV